MQYTYDEQITTWTYIIMIKKDYGYKLESLKSLELKVRSNTLVINDNK